LQISPNSVIVFLSALPFIEKICIAFRREMNEIIRSEKI
jgi:hypothetical protein